MSLYQRMLRATSATRRTAAKLPKRSSSATGQAVREKDRQTGSAHFLLRRRKVVGHSVKRDKGSVCIHDRVCRAWVAVARLADAARVCDEAHVVQGKLGVVGDIGRHGVEAGVVEDVRDVRMADEP